MTQQQSHNIIDQINRMISEAKKIPFTNSVMVEGAKIVSLVHELEESIPDDLAKARHLLSNEAAIIADARQTAEDMITDANNRARKTVDDANLQAQSTKTSADSYAADTRQNADAYAVDTKRNADEQSAAAILAAQQQAAQIIADAQARADQMITAHEITLRAQAQGEHIISTAQAEAETLRQNVYQTVSKCMDAVDEVLVNQINGFRAAREVIEQSQTHQA